MLRRVVVAAMLIAVAAWPAAAQARYLHFAQARRAALRWTNSPGAVVQDCVRVNSARVNCNVTQYDVTYEGDQATVTWLVRVEMRGRRVRAWVPGVHS